MNFPNSFGDFKDLFLDLFDVAPYVTIPFLLLVGLWFTLHIQVAKKAGYPKFFGAVAAVFPVMYILFAFSMWPVQEKLIHISGARYRHKPNSPLAPNYTGRTKR